jgi:hypothetical protein
VVGAVAVTALQPDLVDERSLRLLEGRIVVILQVLGRTALATTAVAFLHDALLACGRVTVAAGCVERTAVRVVDQRPKEGFRRDALDRGLGDWSPVVEGASVAAHVQDDLRREARTTFGEQLDECIGTLLGIGRPATSVGP